LEEQRLSQTPKIVIEWYFGRSLIIPMYDLKLDVVFTKLMILFSRNCVFLFIELFRHENPTHTAKQTALPKAVILSFHRICEFDSHQPAGFAHRRAVLWPVVCRQFVRRLRLF